jgi:hypothetical protein
MGLAMYLFEVLEDAQVGDEDDAEGNEEAADHQVERVGQVGSPVPRGPAASKMRFKVSARS